MSFYITTPIYYVNDVPHLGHAYTTIIADVLQRYHKLFGERTFFLTGTDEHGQKVQNAAAARGVEPQLHCDEMVERYKTIWQDLAIQNDFFIRTTMPFHKSVVQVALQKAFDKGDIYLHQYEGWYSVSEEVFYTDKDLVDGKSPTGKEVQRVVESNYFFRMSRYQQQLQQYIEQHPEFIQPEGKRSEVLGFLRQPLNDLCISRPKSRLSWGVPLPFDGEYVTYVWFDALLNYVSAVGWSQGPGREKQFEEFWPQAVHLIGKDILTQHAVYWPTMLMSLELSLPKTIFAHGWWLNTGGAKMSKSEGPVVRPLELKDEVGLDAFRYFLCRDMPFGADAQFSPELVEARVNAELANNLGNLFSRSTNLVVKFFDGKKPALTAAQPGTKELEALATACAAQVEQQIRSFCPHLAIGAVIELLGATNRYIDSLAPWKTAKTDLACAGECLAASLEVLRISAILLSPVMPNKMLELLRQLGCEAQLSSAQAKIWGAIAESCVIQKAEPLFPRVALVKKEG